MKKSARRLQQGAFAGCAIFLASGAGVALAQDQAAGDAENIEEVLVTGIRKSRIPSAPRKIPIP